MGIVKIDAWGIRAKGLQPRELGAHDNYGVNVYPPCSGMALIALDGLPDKEVPLMDRKHMAGNHVLLRCSAADVLLGHLKPGSVGVDKGDPVAAGDRVARVGNAGNRAEPHLHIQAQRQGTLGEPFSGNPLPMRLDGRCLVRNDRLTAY